MSAVAKINYVSQDEYLQHYANDPNRRWELIDGQVFAQAGASRHHVAIARNLIAHFANHLKGKPCQPYMSDLKVKAEQNYFYPDVVVDCGEDDYTADKPVLIIEVMSKSTAFKDRTKKLWEYAQIESLQEYATLEQDRKMLTLYRRRSEWVGESFSQGDVMFESIDFIMNVDEMYDRVF